jgi:hypothetical protein
MRILQLNIFFTLIITLNSYAQEGKKYYINAYNEQLAMMQGQKPIDFKRVVFITENSFYKGKLNYQTYCNDISAIVIKLKNLISQRGLGQYKTAGNWAAFSYMKDSTAINGFKPYVYDFDDFMGDKDWTKQFITKLMRTHTGNCHSLPYLYKILCEEIGAKASLALGPNHVYIKHIDEKGQWNNVELTSGGFPRDQWIIKQMAISVEAIKSGAYMAPLSDKESIALCMYDLAETYNFQYGQDEFLLNIINTALTYYPTCIPLYEMKSNCCIELVNRENKKPLPDTTYINAKYNLYKAAQAKVNELGYEDEPPEMYKAFVQGMEDEKKKRGLTKAN